MSGFLVASQWLAGLVRSIIKIRVRIPGWQWVDENVVIPESAGGQYTGPLRTGLFPIWRGVWDLALATTTRRLSICASARVGKTLFCISVALYWIAERVGSIVWLDPTAASARKFVRAELDNFLRRCPVVRALAIVGVKTWNTFWKTFRGGRILRVVGSGAESDMHGFSSELAIVNERDRVSDATTDDAGSFDKIVARTRHFTYSRLIVENSTPGKGGEFSPIWAALHGGSSHFCYLPCPHCSADAAAAGQARVVDPLPVGWSPLTREGCLAGWQRLTFANETKTVPFDVDLNQLRGEDGKPLARDKWREERTGKIRFDQFAVFEEMRSRTDATKIEKVQVGWDMEGIERGTVYQCAHCAKDILPSSLPWMLDRYRWVAHNPFAPRDWVSVHLWAAYSPFEYWWVLAKEFLEAKETVGGLIKFHNMTKGEPFIRAGSAIKDDDLDRVLTRVPKPYVKGELPRMPIILAGSVDVQDDVMYYGIRAYGIMENVLGMPTWSALVDWGTAYSWPELLELFGHKPNAAGETRKFSFVDEKGVRHEFTVATALVDSGGEAADRVYAFCARNSARWSAYKGAGQETTHRNTIRMSQAMNEQVELWLCWSDFFAENLYLDCIKHGRVNDEPVHWWLPTNIDREYRKQLTDEYKSPDGWKTRSKNNHFGDVEKMQRALAERIENMLDTHRETLRLERPKAAA